MPGWLEGPQGKRQEPHLCSISVPSRTWDGPVHSMQLGRINWLAACRMCGASVHPGGSGGRIARANWQSAGRECERRDRKFLRDPMHMIFFTTVQTYNNFSIIKISPQLDHRSCTYKLFQLIIEKYISKLHQIFFYKTIPYYMLTV